jgi:hypothetical protein
LVESESSRHGIQFLCCRQQALHQPVPLFDLNSRTVDPLKDWIEFSTDHGTIGPLAGDSLKLGWRGKADGEGCVLGVIKLLDQNRKVFLRL